MVQRNLPTVNPIKHLCAGGLSHYNAGEGGARSVAMALMPNLNGKLRLVYFILGLISGGWGLSGADANWTRITWLALGAVLILFGVIGFCPLLWILGVRGSSS
jgi:hypothetical protein